MKLADSELILNPDGSIYHLNLKPGEVAETIITVGDQDRVSEVSKHFDHIELKRQHREFVTHTGVLNGKRLSVISTGIGPDNIDIVFNEMDALFNIDFDKRVIKKELTQLNFIRLGTSGALQADIDVDSFVAGKIGVGFDNLLHFYGGTERICLSDFTSLFMKHTQWNPQNSHPYAIAADAELWNLLGSEEVLEGITTTNVGFYGPQGRILRLSLHDTELNDKITSFRYHGKPVTNLEMETAAMYCMAGLLGHRALSLNVILANRATGTFSKHPMDSMQALIKYALHKIAP